MPSARTELSRAETMAKLDSNYEFTYKERLKKLKFEEKLMDQYNKECNSQRPAFVNTLSRGHQPTNIDKKISKKPTQTGAKPKHQPQHNRYQDADYGNKDHDNYYSDFFEEDEPPNPPILTNIIRIEADDNDDY